MKSVAILMIAVSIGTLVSCNNGRAYNPDTVIESQSAQTAGAQQTGVTTTGTATEQQPASTPTTAATTGGGTINPAHGQPGHRCDIAVGAPIPPSINKTATTASTPGITPVSTPLNLTPVQNNPAASANPVTAALPPPATTTSAPTGKGLNPAHGQPGHRCDIAVGAPLDSKPAASPATTTATQPASITSAPKTTPPATQKAAAGMNPAHGQPGHRCDIAVGAPLNSKPATTTTTPQVSPIQPMQVTPLMPPAKADTTKN
jgi:hypothetical protein